MRTHTATPLRARAPQAAAVQSAEPRGLLWLQRASGNQAVQRLLVQREHTTDPGEFVTWAESQAFYRDVISDDAGQCAPAAKAIGAALASFTPRYRHIIFFGPRGFNNLNHFVVIVTIAGTDIVIDPTQGQFDGGAAQVARFADWQSRFEGLRLRIQTQIHPPQFELHQWRSKYYEDAAWDAVQIQNWRTMSYANSAGVEAQPAECCVIL